MITIEKGIPAPERLCNRGHVKYPWGKMEIGDSFYVEKTTQQMSACAAQIKKRTGMVFVTQKEGVGSRVWRVE